MRLGLVHLVSAAAAYDALHVEHGVITARECAALVDAAERAGFDLEPDSIDGGAAQDVYVYQGGVRDAALWALVAPLLARLDAVAARWRGALPGACASSRAPAPPLDWVFVRKYGPRSRRNWLMPHTDRNAFSLNVALGDAPAGGGLFVVRGAVDGEVDFKWTLADESGAVPHVAALRRANASDVLFPAQRAGTVVAHNSSVWHGVAPIEAGAKFSLLLFYGMPDDARDPDAAAAAARAADRANALLADALARRDALRDGLADGSCSPATFGREMGAVAEMLRPAAELGDATALYLRAEARLYGVGVERDARAAARDLKRVLRFPPRVLRSVGLSQADALAQLAEALRLQGKPRKAREALERARALELAPA